MAVPVFQMLRFLSVRHLAVIDRLEVEFEPGLNVLTGETGAGKSILVEAIDLLVGGRASADMVRTGEDLATIQAIFETADGREVIVRREISAQGRSRAFIDDALATAAALREFGTAVLSLHGQHEHQALMDPAEHVDLLDAFAGHAEQTAGVSARFDAWRSAVDALHRTQLSDREKQMRIAVASEHLHDIEKVAPKPGEDDDLTAERQVLANADRLSRLSAEAYGALYDSESAALPALAGMWKRVTDLAALDPRFQPYVDQRDDIRLRLEDLAFFLRGYRDTIDAAPERLQIVEDRLAALERVKRRHGPLLADVLARAEALRRELDELGAGDEHAARLADRERDTRAAFVTAATALSIARAASLSELGRALERELGDLAMPACRIDVRVRALEDADRWTRRGVDDVEFFFSPNPGEEVRPLARIASGGELSRFMLALRLLTMPDEAGRTLIFDEIDAGIGGAAADAVGVRLRALGRRCQILSVTHLAAIAARADTHFAITKHVRSGRTHSSAVKLDGPDREREVGRMIAGAAVSATVLESARELLTRGQSEQTTKQLPESKSPGRARGVRRGA